jgi:hypothetical protein
MPALGDFFQWDRFVTAAVIKLFYWLAVITLTLLAIAGAISSRQILAADPLLGALLLIALVLGALAAAILARIGAELVLMVFRISEHLGAIRNFELERREALR